MNDIAELSDLIRLLDADIYMSGEEPEEENMTIRQSNLLEYLRKIRNGVIKGDAKNKLVETVKNDYTAEEIERANDFLNAEK